MSTLILIHIISVSFWAGLVLCEIIIEFSHKKFDGWAHIAKIHYWIDLLFELPVLCIILITGLLLFHSISVVSPMLYIKIIAACISILANLICFILVVLRHRNSGSPEKLKKYHLWIRFTGIGIPFGIVAAVIGFSNLFGH